MTEGGDFDNGCGGDSFNLINIPRHRSPSNSFTSDDEHRNFPGNTSMGRAASIGPSQTASQRKSSASLARTPSTAHSTGGHSFRPHENPFAATLNTVEEEKYECSDSSDDELVEIKHVIPDIKTDNITAYANETGDEGERNGQGHKRRGLRHYARKKSSSSSRVNRVITWRASVGTSVHPVFITHTMLFLLGAAGDHPICAPGGWCLGLPPGTTG